MAFQDIVVSLRGLFVWAIDRFQVHHVQVRKIDLRRNLMEGMSETGQRVRTKLDYVYDTEDDAKTALQTMIDEEKLRLDGIPATSIGQPEKL